MPWCDFSKDHVYFQWPLLVQAVVGGSWNLRCRISDGALSGESKLSCAFLGVGHHPFNNKLTGSSFHFGLTGFFQLYWLTGSVSFVWHPPLPIYIWYIYIHYLYEIYYIYNTYGYELKYKILIKVSDPCTIYIFDLYFDPYPIILHNSYPWSIRLIHTPDPYPFLSRWKKTDAGPNATFYAHTNFDPHITILVAICDTFIVASARCLRCLRTGGAATTNHLPPRSYCYCCRLCCCSCWSWSRCWYWFTSFLCLW